MSRLRPAWKVPYICSEFKSLRLMDLKKFQRKYYSLRRRIGFIRDRFYTKKINFLYTFTRNSVVPEYLINKVLLVYNGKFFKKFTIKRFMVGMKVGSFSLTKKYGQIKFSDRKKKKKKGRR